MKIVEKDVKTLTQGYQNGDDLINLKAFEKVEDDYVIPKTEKYFGMLVTLIDGLVPDTYNDDDNEIVYCFNYEDIKSFEKDVPMIFRVIDNGIGNHQFAQEIMTGKLILIGEYDSLDSCIGSNNSLYSSIVEKMETFKKSPLVISNDCNDGYYKVDQNFKKLYAEYYRGHELDFKKMMDEVEDSARDLFDTKIKGLAEDAQDLAYTDNVIYNFEMRLKRQ